MQEKVIVKKTKKLLALKKNLGQICKETIKNKGDKHKKINLCFQDEIRFGLFTNNCKALAAKGVKPICPSQQVFQSLYLFDAVSPIDGKSFFLQMPHCNAANFQIFLDDFATQELKN